MNAETPQLVAALKDKVVEMETAHREMVHEMAHLINRLKNSKAQEAALKRKLINAQNLAASRCDCFADNSAPTFTVQCRQLYTDMEAAAKRKQRVPSAGTAGPLPVLEPSEGIAPLELGQPLELPKKPLPATTPRKPAPTPPSVDSSSEDRSEDRSEDSSEDSSKDGSSVESSSSEDPLPWRTVKRVGARRVRARK